MTRSILLALALAASGCAMKSGNLPAEEAPTTETETATTSTKTTRIADEPRVCAPSPGPSRREQVCWRWRCDGDASRPATWGGDGATCDAADLDADAADRALRRINVHRALADLSPVVLEDAWTPAAQECALIAHANAKLSHTPPEDWACWSPLGAATSELSLVANRSAPLSIAAYFEDPGNETTMVHRRWLLDEGLTTVGLGSTSKFSCVVVDGRALGGPKPAKAAAGRGWAAWPPAGPVPFDVFTEEKLDTAGWTIQSTSDELATADVTVTEDGEPRPITITRLGAGLGSRSAVRFVPNGWSTEAGHAYVVTAGAIQLTVEPVDCDVP
ncbi:MAG: hypothetical protein KIT84_29890 [Labilithrix sp.]|nr:hypothetical protein [Labilithrix sp.]MCW5815276.1 hypothetical protein [Labilithrix sp.]